VRSLDNDSRGSSEKLGATAKEVELMVGDIRDAAAVARAVKGMEWGLPSGLRKTARSFFTPSRN